MGGILEHVDKINHKKNQDATSLLSICTCMSMHRKVWIPLFISLIADIINKKQFKGERSYCGSQLEEI